MMDDRDFPFRVFKRDDNEIEVALSTSLGYTSLKCTNNEAVYLAYLLLDQALRKRVNR